MAHLSDDLIFQIPRENKQIIRPHLIDSRHRINRNVHSGRVASMFVGIAIDCKIEKIRADATIVEQCIPFTGSTISAYLRTLLFAFNQEQQKLALRAMNFRSKPRVTPDVLKSNRALVSQQCIDARRCHMSAVGMAKINAQGSAMGSELFDVKYLETVLACESINRDERKV